MKVFQANEMVLGTAERVGKKVRIPDWLSTWVTIAGVEILTRKRGYSQIH